MILAPLSRHLAVCPLSEVQCFLDLDKDFWHIISVRDTTRPRIQFRHAAHVLPLYFEDTETVEEGCGWNVMSNEQVAEIWQHVESTGEKPLLVHCVAGLSRSTAVACAIIVRALVEAGTPTGQVPAEAVDRLLQIRPPAFPNGLVLLRLLEHVLPPEEARAIAQGIRENDRIMRNRFVRVH